MILVNCGGAAGCCGVASGYGWCAVWCTYGAPAEDCLVWYKQAAAAKKNCTHCLLYEQGSDVRSDGGERFCFVTSRSWFGILYASRLK